MHMLRRARWLLFVGIVVFMTPAVLTFRAAGAEEVVSTLSTGSDARHHLTPEKLAEFSRMMAESHGIGLREDSVRLAREGVLSWHFVGQDLRGQPCLLSWVGDRDDYVLAATCAPIDELRTEGVSLTAYAGDRSAVAVLVPDGFTDISGGGGRMGDTVQNNVAVAETRGDDLPTDVSIANRETGAKMVIELPSGR